MLSGIEFRSVAPGTPLAEAPLTYLRPSTRTSTRFEPRYLRSTSAEPAPTPPPSGGLPKLPLLLNRLFSAPPELGRRWIMSAAEVRPVRAMSASSRKVTGAGLSSGLRRIREPVMTMSWSFWAAWVAACSGSGSSGWVVEGWAKAGPAASAVARASEAPPRRSLRFDLAMSVPPPAPAATTADLGRPATLASDRPRAGRQIAPETDDLIWIVATALQFRPGCATSCRSGAPPGRPARRKRGGRRFTPYRPRHGPRDDGAGCPAPRDVTME